MSFDTISKSVSLSVDRALSVFMMDKIERKNALEGEEGSHG